MIQFVRPWFLLGLTALAVPVLLHLMQRQIPRRLVFPSIRFILQAREPQRGHRSIRDLLVLLLRMLLLSAAVLILARPRWVETSTGGGVKGRREIVFFFDMSASMSAYDWRTYALAEIDKVDNEFQDGVFGFIASANGVLTKRPVGTSLDEIRQWVGQAEPTVYPGKHDAAVAAVGELLAKDAYNQNIIFILSDLQSADWSSVSLRDAAKIADVRFLKPTRKTKGNLAVMSARYDPVLRRDMKRLQVVARLRNFGIAPRTFRLLLKTGEKKVEHRVSLRPEATENFVLELNQPEADEAVVQILDDAGYTLDNQLSMWVGPLQPARVAIIGENNTRSRLEAFFLRNALSVLEPGYDSFEVTVTTSSFFMKEKLSRWHCVFVLDAFRDASNFELELARDWVKGGGAIACMAGRNSADCMAKMNKVGLCKTRFAGFGGSLDQLQAFTIATSSGDPLLAPFDDEPSDLFVFPIYRYARLQPPRDAQTLLTLDTEAPFLVHEQLGEGSAYLFGIGLLPGWSDFPTSQSFLPLVRRIVEELPAVKNRGVMRYVIGGTIPPSLVEGAVTAADERLVKPGVHVIGGHPLQVNISREESDFTSVDEAELFGEPDTSNSKVMAGVGGSVKDVFGLGRMVAWIILIVLLIELIAANMRMKVPEAGGDEE